MGNRGRAFVCRGVPADPPGLEYTNASRAIILVYTSPIVVASMALAAAGIYLVNRPATA